MARNRKRAKERRDRRSQPVGSRRLAGARVDAAEGPPSPIEHAAPDAELADAQLALGRPDDIAEDQLEIPADDPAAEADLTAQSLAADPYGDGGGGSVSPPPAPPGGGSAAALPAPGGAPEARARPGSRVLGFLEGSWRELQRVQWPDRRQVMQATAVVIGFVIVAGVYLGVADTAASHLMDYILTGK